MTPAGAPSVDLSLARRLARVALRRTAADVPRPLIDKAQSCLLVGEAPAGQLERLADGRAEILAVYDKPAPVCNLAQTATPAP